MLRRAECRIAQPNADKINPPTGSFSPPLVDIVRKARRRAYRFGGVAMTAGMDLVVPFGELMIITRAAYPLDRPAVSLP